MILRHTVTKTEEDKAVKDLIRLHFSLSTGQLRRLKRREGGIRLDGKSVTVVEKVREGQVLECLADDTDTSDVTPCDLPLTILYEDEWMTVIDKAPGLPTHPSSLSPKEPSVAGAYLYYKKGGVFHPVNRLDKGTSGIMVIAANAHSHKCLAQSLHSGQFRREYLAVCQGFFKQKEGEISAPIGRRDGSVIQREVRPDGKEAVTRYRVVQEGKDCSLVRLCPLTGRTHQLRVHMAYLGHPLVGDFLYGTEDPDRILRPPLHSTYLCLRHPAHGQMLRLEAPLPQDMERLLQE